MIRLRRAVEDDCDLVYQWRNDKLIRKNSLSDAAIPYSKHVEWFLNSLVRKDRVILLAYENELAVGVLRFDFFIEDGDIAEVSIYVSPGLWGQGIGKRMLVAGEQWLRDNMPVRHVVAKVKPANEASLKMFQSCGFEVDHMFFKKSIAGDEGQDL